MRDDRYKEKKRINLEWVSEGVAARVDGFPEWSGQKSVSPCVCPEDKQTERPQ